MYTANSEPDNRQTPLAMWWGITQLKKQIFASGVGEEQTKAKSRVNNGFSFERQPET